MASPLESAITLEDVFVMVVGKRVPLAPELAGYLSLEIAEKAEAAGGSGGGDIDPRSVYIADEGTVALVRPRGDPGDGDAERSIRAILGELLDASGSSTPALTTVSRRGKSGSLRSLMEDIEAALIPVNRAAGRRALARLAREVKRVTHGVGRNAGRSASGEWTSRASRPGVDEASAPSRQRSEPTDPRRVSPFAPRPPPPAPAATTARPPPAPEEDRPTAIPEMDAPEPRKAPPEAPLEPELPPIAMFDNTSDVDSLLEQFSLSTTQSEQEVSRDLKGLVDVGQTAVPPVVQSRPLPPAAAAEVDDLLALTEDAAPSARRPAAREAPKSRPAPARESDRPATVDPRELPTHQSIAVNAAWSRPRKKRTDYWVVIALLAVLAAASATVWFFKPGFLSGRTAEKVAEERAANERAKQAAALAQQALSCHAALDVTDVPTGAEVLLRVGQAPVDVPHLPVGARLEFVATADGYTPKRVVVPAGATWDPGADGKPRFEVAVQLDRSNPKAKLGESWPPGEAGSEVGGKGPPGTVHLVSTPRGVEVWMLAGLGPEALVEQLPCDQSVDVLVAGPTTYRKRLHATATDFAPRPGEPQSKLAKLSAR
jgi:hypothetical protein